MPFSISLQMSGTFEQRLDESVETQTFAFETHDFGYAFPYWPPGKWHGHQRFILLNRGLTNLLRLLTLYHAAEWIQPCKFVFPSPDLPEALMW